MSSSWCVVNHFIQQKIILNSSVNVMLLLTFWKFDWIKSVFFFRKPPSAPSSVKSKQAQTPAPPVIRDKPPPAVYDKPPPKYDKPPPIHDKPPPPAAAARDSGKLEILKFYFGFKESTSKYS